MKVQPDVKDTNPGCVSYVSGCCVNVNSNAEKRMSLPLQNTQPGKLKIETALEETGIYVDTSSYHS